MSQSALHNQRKKELAGPPEQARWDSRLEKLSCGKKPRAEQQADKTAAEK